VIALPHPVDLRGAHGTPSASSISVSPLHAQPPPTLQVDPAGMQLSPHALPLSQTLQHWPVARLQVSQPTAPSTNTIATIHLLIADQRARLRLGDPVATKTSHALDGKNVLPKLQSGARVQVSGAPT